jgi:hypothetical protein
LLVNTLSTIALGAQPARALAPGVLVPGEGLAVRKGRLADEPAEADASAPGDGEAGAPLAGAPLAGAPLTAALAAAPLARVPL